MVGIDQQVVKTRETISYDSLIDDVGGLASPPDVCVRLFELIHSPKSSAAQIADIVSLDPSLTVKLLRVANSAYYQLRAKVDTVTRAIAVIGNSELYNLVLSISAVKSFSNIPNELVSMDTFWRHSVYTGLLSRSIAKRVNVLHPERLFVAGLLHDIGSLVLYHYHPQTMRELLLLANEDEELMYHAEQDTLGFNHASLAGGLLAEWQLPDTLQQTVAWHHEPMFASLAYTEACILKTASQMANETEDGHFLGTGSTVDLEDAMPVCEGLQDVDIELIREEVAEQFESTLQSLL